MRVIAGTSRGRRLTMFEGLNVRPTPDRVREALFSILQSKLGSFKGLRVLDLFAGSGALAIEALSRGAASACLVEKDRAAEKIILKNLELCQVSEQTSLIMGDALQNLPALTADSFDLIFLDPPYAKGLAELALGAIAKQALLSEQGVLCAETGAKEVLPDNLDGLQRIDQRRYGSIMLNFYVNASQRDLNE